MFLHVCQEHLMTSIIRTEKYPLDLELWWTLVILKRVVKVKWQDKSLVELSSKENRKWKLGGQSN